MVCWFVWFIWFVLFFWFLGCVWLRNFVRDFDTGSFLPDKLEKPEKPKRRFLIQHADEPRSESTRLNSSHVSISYAVFCLKKKKKLISDQVPQASLKTSQLYHIFCT